MRYQLLQTICIFAAAFPASLRAVPGGLEHRWSFNGNLIDSVTGQKATIETPALAAVSADLTSQPGQVRLMGGDRSLASYVSLGSGLIGGKTGPFTIELWGTQYGVLPYSRIFDFGGGPTECLCMSWSGDSGINSDSVLFAQSSAQVNSFNTNAPYTLGKPYHIVFTVEPGAGEWGASRYTWYTAPADSRDPVVANGFFDSGYLIKGLTDSKDWLGRSEYPDPTANASYDEIRIYDHALSAEEIAASRQAGPDGIVTPDPVAVNDAVTVGASGQVALDVFANDQILSPEDATLEIVNAPSSGTAVVQQGGWILYAHTGSASVDSFTYAVTDAFHHRSNVATVSVSISGAARLAAPTLNVPGTPPPESIAAVDAFPGLTFRNALCIRNIPGETDRIFIGERAGVISYVPDIHAASPERKVLLDIGARISFDNTNEGELGLLSFAFHPDFAHNGYLYVFYTAPGAPYYDRVSRFTVTKDGSGNPVLDNPVAPSASEVILINQLDEAFNHNAGDMHFGPEDGFLYISMGDEGEQMNQSLNSQRIDKDLFGGVLRIDVDKNALTSIEPNPHDAIPTDKGLARFSIPKTNPFILPAQGGDWDGTYDGDTIADPSKVRTELWVTGLRSPWRMAFDTEAPYELWLGDVGQDSYEEVDIIARGNNYGWAFREGAHQTPGTPSEYIGVPPDGFSSTPPVWDYPHPGTDTDPSYSGQSITGGVVYHGTGIPELTGAYICADFRLGNIWSIRRSTGDPVVQRVAGMAGIAAFGLDPSDGEVLMANYSEGKIMRLVKQPTAQSTYPQLLSQTGIFANLATLTPNPGIVPYQPNVSFWSDGAEKSRWFAIPSLNDQIGFQPDAAWSFPQGMIWVKHFDMELIKGDASTKKRLETRILVRTATGTYGVSYRWNDAGTDATLVDTAGETFDVATTDNGTVTHQNWEIPSRAACMLCHTPVAGHALGFTTRQMDRDTTLFGQSGNQIDLLKLAGYLAGPEATPALVTPLVAGSDESALRELRVRSYLAANCVQCHQPGGAAPSTWDARPQLTLEETGLINGSADRPGTDPADRIIVPGSTAHSILLKRLQASGGFTRMPPVGTHVLDQASIDLVTQWIARDLPQRRLYTDWRNEYFAAGDAHGDRTADPDGDGVSNYDEFLLGTSPLVADAPASPQLSLSGGMLSVQAQRPAYRSYVLETSDDLIQWAPLDDPDNSVLYSDSRQPVSWSVSAAAGRRFVRIRVSEP